MTKIDRRAFIGCVAALPLLTIPLPESQLREVPWFVGDYDTGHWQTCDLCDESFLQDIWAEPQNEIRKFYCDDDESGLIVCEHCLAEYVSCV